MAVTVEISRCIGCENCAAICPTGAIQVRGGKASVKEETCVECGACVYDCPMDAITLPREEIRMAKTENAIWVIAQLETARPWV